MDDGRSKGGIIHGSGMERALQCVPNRRTDDRERARDWDVNREKERRSLPRINTEIDRKCNGKGKRMERSNQIHYIHEL